MKTWTSPGIVRKTLAIAVRLTKVTDCPFSFSNVRIKLCTSKGLDVFLCPACPVMNKAEQILQNRRKGICSLKTCHAGERVAKLNMDKFSTLKREDVS